MIINKKSVDENATYLYKYNNHFILTVFIGLFVAYSCPYPSLTFRYFKTVFKFPKPT